MADLICSEFDSNQPLNTNELPKRDEAQLLFIAANAPKCFGDWVLPNIDEIKSQINFDIAPNLDIVNQCLTALTAIIMNPNFLKGKDGKVGQLILSDSPFNIVYNRYDASFTFLDEQYGLEVFITNNKIAYNYENGSDETQFSDKAALEKPFGYDPRSTFFSITDNQNGTKLTINTSKLDPADEDAPFELGQMFSLAENTVYISGGISIDVPGSKDDIDYRKFDLEVRASN